MGGFGSPYITKKKLYGNNKYRIRYRKYNWRFGC